MSTGEHSRLLEVHMPRRFVCLVGLLVGLLGATLAVDSLRAETPPSAESLQTWVAGLKSTQFEVREQSHWRLRQAGSVAIESLEQNIRDADDEETRARCLDILSRLSFGTDTDTEERAAAALDRLAEGEAVRAGLVRSHLTRLAKIRNDQALERLTEKGMRYEHNGLGSYWLTFDEQWKGDEQDLRRLRFLSHADRIHISCEQADDRWIEHLKGLEVSYLDIKRTKITDAGIRRLRELRLPLVYLILKHVEGITDASIDDLAALETLSDLRVYGTRMSAEGAERLMAKSLELSQFGSRVELSLDHRDGAFLGVSCNGHPLGCLITQVNPNTAAARGGIETGDVVTHYRGSSVMDFTSLTHLIARNRVGDEVEIDLARNWSVREARIDPVPTVASLGIEGRPHKLGLEITRVDPQGKAASQLRVGDVLVRVVDLVTAEGLAQEFAPPAPFIPARVVPRKFAPQGEQTPLPPIEDWDDMPRQPGERLDSLTKLARDLRQVPAGQPVVFLLASGGSLSKVRVQLGEWE